MISCIFLPVRNKSNFCDVVSSRTCERNPKTEDSLIAVLCVFRTQNTLYEKHLPNKVFLVDFPRGGNIKQYFSGLGLSGYTNPLKNTPTFSVT